ncbi:MAG: DUF2490 domain-containing protein [Bacteroidia bacterium]
MKKWILIIMVFLHAVGTIAQSAETVNPLNSWYFFNHRTTLSDKWSASLEIHERTQGLGEVHKNFLLRPSVDYHLNSNAEFSVGYSLVQGPYIPFLGTTWSQVEHNSWEQFFFKFNVGQFHLYNRLRLENRWVGQFNADGTKANPLYANRFRYRMGFTHDLKSLGKNTLFVQCFDELWMNMNENLEFQSFGRNWLYAGLGWKTSPMTNYQIGYMKQRDFKNGQFYNTPIIQATVTHNLKLN